jgi:hypothetical protein
MSKTTNTYSPELRERAVRMVLDHELLAARQHPHPMIPTVVGDDPRDRRPGQEIHQLGEQGLTDVHGRLLGKVPKNRPRSSNPHRPFFHASPRNW